MLYYLPQAAPPEEQSPEPAALPPAAGEETTGQPGRPGHPNPAILQAWRAQHGLTQPAAAALCGTRTNVWHRWERGLTRMEGPTQRLWALLQYPAVLALARQLEGMHEAHDDDPLRVRTLQHAHGGELVPVILSMFKAYHDAMDKLSSEQEKSMAVAMAENNHL
jgi:DNA-binding transcriptional regulator YiaG